MIQSKAIKTMVSRQVAIWLGLNLLDLGLSIVAFIYGGARELLMLEWVLQKLPRTVVYYESSFVWYGLYKMGLAVCVPFLLAGIKKQHLLKWLNIGLGCLCLYIVIMLIKTFS